MKNVLEVLRSKEMQLKELESQIESLRAAARLLAEPNDSFGSFEPSAGTTAPARPIHPSPAAKALP